MKAKHRIIFFGAILVTMLIHACYYDKGDLLYPGSNTGCDSSNVSYVNVIVPMLSSQCYGCHTGNTAGGGIVMGSYDQDKAIAQNGKLMGAVGHTPGFSPMPKGGTQLSSCQQSKIRSWISSACPNN
jgi:hypothetical protein